MNNYTTVKVARCCEFGRVRTQEISLCLDYTTKLINNEKYTVLVRLHKPISSQEATDLELTKQNVNFVTIECFNNTIEYICFGSIIT